MTTCTASGAPSTAPGAPFVSDAFEPGDDTSDGCARRAGEQQHLMGPRSELHQDEGPEVRQRPSYHVGE